MKPKRYHRMIAVVTVVASTAWGVVVNDFGRYEIILQRRPFGEAPAASDGNTERKAPVVRTGPSFVDSLTMCAITSGGGAVRVGFLDGKARPPKTYFLFVGEREDGIHVVSADYEAETVTLEKDGDTRVLNMGGGVVSPTPSRNRSAQRSAPFRRMRRPKIQRTPEQIAEARRLAIERKSPILKGKEYEKHIRKYNMDLIRSGGDMGVPLPIALTNEEDAQLVNEGVLPPPGK
jgi:hypothetical protein